MRPVHACWNTRNKRPSGAFYLGGQPGPALFAVILVLFLLSCAFPPAEAKDAATLNEEGTTLLRNGDLQQALELFDQAIAADPTYSPARLNKGIALLSMNRPQEALLSLEIVLDRDPASVPAWIYRGDALMAMGKKGEAADSYRTAERLDPGNSLVAERLAGTAGSVAGGIAPFPLTDTVLLACACIVAACILSTVIAMGRKKEGSAGPRDSGGKKGQGQRPPPAFSLRRARGKPGKDIPIPAPGGAEKSRKVREGPRRPRVRQVLGSLSAWKRGGRQGPDQQAMRRATGRPVTGPWKWTALEALPVASPSRTMTLRTQTGSSPVSTGFSRIRGSMHPVSRELHCMPWGGTQRPSRRSGGSWKILVRIQVSSPSRRQSC